MGNQEIAGRNFETKINKFLLSESLYSCKKEHVRGGSDVTAK